MPCLSNSKCEPSPRLGNPQVSVRMIPKVEEKFKLKHYRDLLYAVFYSGDGNFHLQSKLRSKTLAEDPSMFSDSGFFAPYSTYQNYVKTALSFKPPKKVCKRDLH
jgi:hypothetical protein